MTLREEIEQITDSWTPGPGGTIDQLVELFEKWAQEIVGSDYLSKNEQDPEKRRFLEGYNHAKQEIRAKIKEATK